MYSLVRLLERYKGKWNQSLADDLYQTMGAGEDLHNFVIIYGQENNLTPEAVAYHIWGLIERGSLYYRAGKIYFFRPRPGELI